MSGEIGAILATIRTLESGGRYDIGPNRGNASGAYQYIASTWNNYAGYAHAYLAPPAIQDQRALADVTAILNAWDGDVSMIPVIWYYPRAATNPTLMDQVPVPEAGNRLTVREYQHRWLKLLAYITGDPDRYLAAAYPSELRYLAALPPEVANPDGELAQIAFPLLGGATLSLAPACDADECPDGTEAIIYGEQLQPVLAVTTGVITAIEPGAAATGEVSLTLLDAHGRTYRYIGFNDDHPGTDDGVAPLALRFTPLAQVGSQVRIGQIIGFLGNSDPLGDALAPVLAGRPATGARASDRATTTTNTTTTSTTTTSTTTTTVPGPEPAEGGDTATLITPPAAWPHLRLVIYGPDGTRLDADRLVADAQRRQACHIGLGPWSLGEPPDSPVLPEDVVVESREGGSWTISADGRVTATGPAALILPAEGCEWAPTDAYGPGAAGGVPADEWSETVVLSAAGWLSSLATTAVPWASPRS